MPFEPTQSVYVNSGGVIAAARILGAANESPSESAVFVSLVRRYWVDMCVLGQHLPQMYRTEEIHELKDAAQAKSLGFCGNCLGYGNLGELDLSNFYSYGIDEVPDPCPECGATGREFIRVELSRDKYGVEGHIKMLPHTYLGNAKKGDLCWRCSISPADHDKMVAAAEKEDGGYIGGARINIAVDEDQEASNPE